MLLRTRIARTMLVPALVTFALPGVAGAQLTQAGVVTTLQGTATVARATTPQPLPLKFKDTVFVKDRITTGNDSIARILLGGKAIVTVRERSVLTITEVPGTSTIDLGIGKIALAVVKERMKSGETIEIRTPNAVAGIRGTVVITEVDQKTAQLGGAAAAFTSRFTVLQGIVAVSQYNPLTRQLGPTVNLGALQTTGITGSAAPRPPVTITPEAAKQLASEYKTTIKEAPPAANAAITNSQVQQAAAYVGSVVAPPKQGDQAKSVQEGPDADSSGNGKGDSPTSGKSEPAQAMTTPTTTTTTDQGRGTSGSTSPGPSTPSTKQETPKQDTKPTPPPTPTTTTTTTPTPPQPPAPPVVKTDAPKPTQTKSDGPKPSSGGRGFAAPPSPPPPPPTPTVRQTPPPLPPPPPTPVFRRPETPSTPSLKVENRHKDNENKGKKK